VPSPLFVNNGLPELSLKAGDTDGTFSWIGTANSTDTEYTWTFTPTDTDNYESTSGTMNFNFLEAEVTALSVEVNPGATIYDAYSLTDLPKYITVNAVYEDGSSAPIGGYTVSTADGKLTAPKTVITVREPGGMTSDPTEIPVSAAQLERLDVTCSQQFTYPVTAETIRDALTVYAKWNYSNKTIAVTDKTKLEVTGDIDVNTTQLNVKYTGTEINSNFPVTINKGTLKPTVTFEDLTVKYDGTNKKIEATVSGLPEGVTFTPAYTVSGSATEYVADGYANAGTYNYSVTFTHENPNYEQYTAPKTATLKINKADYPGAGGIKFEGNQFYNDGSAHKLVATNLPEGVTVTYSSPDYNGGAAQADPIEFTAEGKYKITAHFAFVNAADGDNYNDIPAVTKEMEISNLLPHDMSGATASGSDGVSGDIENGFTATYGGTDFDISLDENSLPEGVSVKETVYEKFDGENWVPVTDDDGNPAKPNGAGQYRAKVSFENSKPGYAKPQDMEISFTVDKATIDTSETKLTPNEDSGLKADGNGGYKGTYNPDGKFEFNIGENDLPAGVTPKEPVYKKLVDGNWETVTEIKEAGTYKVVVELEPTDPDNYNEIAPLEVSVTIGDAEVTGISAEIEEGAKFDLNNTLDDVIAKIKAEISYNNGAKEAAETEELTITCATLREGGLLDVGKQVITVKYSDGIETTVEIIVGKGKVALPVYNGTLSYNGNELKPTAADFTGFDGALMAFVESKTAAGVNAGTYKAVFALTDPDRYEWATATTLKKTVFAVALYDLEPGEAEVNWTLEKAVITATIGADGKPVFKSDGISAAALAQAVGVKYFADEACTQEVAADKLAPETTYYMQADLLDDVNFKLDDTVAQVVNVPYTTPGKELTVWDKIVRF
ncbi:MAG: hypothetical protein K2H78_03690, partial [Clostridia bacterium]|nr:hypothetical protein [Clostridia bacterium]